MRQVLRVLTVVATAGLFFQFGCKDSGTGSGNGQWESLGFEDKLALRLVLAEPYLYVCGGSDGLWRENIRQPGSQWQYLGLADTSLGRYFNRGVQHVLIQPLNPDWILVAFQPDQATDYGVYRSFDAGNSWAPADSGLEFFVNSSRYLNRIQRFLQRLPSVIGAGPRVWRSTDWGSSWHGGISHSDIAGNVYVFVSHPRQHGMLWLGGENFFFGPLLSFSSDAGNTWTYIELSRVVPVDNAVYSIALDPLDPNVVYVGMQGAMIKTTDSGESWIVSLMTHRHGAFFRAILSDPRDRNHLWAAAGKTIIETFDAGKTWREIQSPNETQVLDMLWDDTRESFYVATESGIYQFKP